MGLQKVSAQTEAVVLKKVKERQSSLPSPTTSCTPSTPEPQRAEALKFDGEKPRMELLPTAPLVGVAEILTFGAKKYAPHNWRNGFDYSRLVGAAYRHLSSFNDGEDLDPESGKSHIDHAICALMFLSEQIKKGTGNDDRFKPS